MKDRFNDISRQIFYDVAQKDEQDVDFILSSKKDFPYFFKKPGSVVVIPIPRLINEKFYLHGFVFDKYEEQSLGLWSLYLASIYHMGAHMAVSNFEIYKNWHLTKTQEHATKVIDFIEDFRAECYLKENFPAPAQIIEELDSKYSTYFQNIFSETNITRKKFASLFRPDENEKLIAIKEKIIQNINDSSNLIECADFIYENQSLLNSFILPYHDHLNEFVSSEIFQPIKFNPDGDFEKTCSLLNDTWIREITKQRKILQKYKKLSGELRFDEIEFAPENFSEYLRLSNDTSDLVRKIKSKLKLVRNVIDTPTTEKVGILEMQKAIQAIASDNPDIEMFEQDEERRVSESWAIILDSSASMEGKFYDLKKFTLCLSEAAEEINSVNGKWSLSAFNNNFYVVKDSTERYEQQVKSRFGGLESQGLSFIPDAIILSARTLRLDDNEKKYIFLVSDGLTLGYDDADNYFQEAVRTAKNYGINVIGIGVTGSTSKLFSACFGYEEVATTVSKFIRAYTAVVQGAL
ncbi:MAG: vWA domain-containing protein [Nitrosopumilaceae archaeon]